MTETDSLLPKSNIKAETQAEAPCAVEAIGARRKQTPSGNSQERLLESGLGDDAKRHMNAAGRMLYEIILEWKERRDLPKVPDGQARHDAL